MHKRTFEVLAKFICAHSDTTVKFDKEDGGACANVMTNEIRMPEKISGDNALGALALLMHEAAHLKYTKPLPIDKIIETPTDKFIHNVMEDVRIDHHNFQLLPNIKEFYRELNKKIPRIEKSPAPLKVKAMIASIDYCEGFRRSFPKDIQDILEKDGLVDAVWDGVQAGNCGDWKGYKDAITKVKKILKIDDSKEPKLQFVTVKDITGKKFVKIKDGTEGEGEGQGQPDPNGKGEGKSPLEGLDGDRAEGVHWGDGTCMKGSSAYISEIALEEQTVQAFKELLSLKERRIVSDGINLNTDSLISFFTGDLEELFQEECIIKQKKSKIMFLMDCSGSMSSGTIGLKGENYDSRCSVVASCVKKIISIIEEVRNSESLDVDWAISMFDGSYHELTKDNWESRYGAHGGTTFSVGMEGAIEELMSDYTVEGKRIIVAFSDGEVGQHDIDEVQELMQSTGSDVRYLVIGVGCMPDSPMKKGVIGDRVILGKDDANAVLLDTLRELIE